MGKGPKTQINAHEREQTQTNAISENYSQTPPSYGFGRYGVGVFGAQDSVPRDRCSVGTRHPLFSVILVCI